MSGSQSEPTQSEAAPQPELSDEVPGTHELGASVNDAYERLLQVRGLELKRGAGFSGSRLMLTLTHKYGFSQEDAEAAVAKYRAAVSKLKGQGKVEADLRPSGMGVTPVECSVFASLVDVTAALRVMARSTYITPIAERGVRAILDLARKKSYRIKTTENRAFFTTEFRRDDEDYSLYMMGWHGTGRFAGGEKAILEFYDSREGEHPVVSIGVLNEQNVTPKNAQKVVDHILEYIEKHG